ncbi:MAG TPA: glycosyltransferase family 9 protein [Terriglobia bacterium]|nr:glycosyltransferase family 9 protein [Terriglobia bacterium]
MACGPVASEIKRRDRNAWVLWICRPQYRQLVRAIPGVDSALDADTLDEVASSLTELRRWQVVDMTLRGKKNSADSGEWAKATGDPAVTVDSYYSFGPLLPALSRGAGFSVSDSLPRLNLSNRDRQFVDALNLPAAFIAIHCVSDEAARNWTPGGWQALVDHLIRHDQHVVEIGHRKSGLFDDHPGVHDMTGRTPVLATAELLRRARLFIGIDSGPAHLANAVGTPGLILLGRYRIFQRYVPYTGLYGDGVRALILQHHEECEFTPVHVVLEALKEVLEGIARGNEGGFGIRTLPGPRLHPAPSPGDEVTIAPTDMAGHCDSTDVIDGQFRVSGWAAFVDQTRSPDNLLLVESLDGNRFRVIRSFPFSRLERPDVATHFNNARLAYTGWALRIPCELLSGGRKSLVAHDAHLNRFAALTRLSGEWPAEQQPSVDAKTATRVG